MSYQIVFRGQDVPSITVDNQRGEKLKALWFDNKKDSPIDIDGNAYRMSEIKRITQVPDPIRPPITQTALPQGKQCQGQYSIQNEINKIAKDEHPIEWAKFIRDKKWRETTRQKLRAQAGVLWCDYKVGECVCD